MSDYQKIYSIYLEFTLWPWFESLIPRLMGHQLKKRVIWVSSKGMWLWWLQRLMHYALLHHNLYLFLIMGTVVFHVKLICVHLGWSLVLEGEWMFNVDSQNDHGKDWGVTVHSRSLFLMANCSIARRYQNYRPIMGVSLHNCTAWLVEVNLSKVPVESMGYHYIEPWLIMNWLKSRPISGEICCTEFPYDFIWFQ